MDKTEKKDRVVGVYDHPAGGHEIKSVVDGKPRSEYRRTREAAERRADDLRARLEGEVQPTPPIALGGALPEGPRGHLLRLLVATGDALAADPDNEGLQRALKALASASTACAKLLAAPAADEQESEFQVQERYAAMREHVQGLMDQALRPHDAAKGFVG